MTDRKKLVAKLDKLFSEYIRKRAMKEVHGCERCRAWKADWTQLQCGHFHSRRKHSTRWHPLNACGLCGGCHLYLDSHPIEKVQWFANRLGETEFNKLNIAAEMTYKTDYAAEELYLREKLKEL